MKKMFLTFTLMLLALTANAQSCPDGNHPHLINLGLPSGTNWACCNVDAARPEGHGGYYAWGETTTKSDYSWKTYKHSDGSDESCHDIGESICGTQYDVAHVKWGGAWQLPTEDLINELFDKCTSEWATVNGVNGLRFTGPNGGSIFLPASGYRSGTDLKYRGYDGDYWSGTDYRDDAEECTELYFREEDRDNRGSRSEDRSMGFTVRPVWVPLEEICPDGNHPHMIDLGLPSGTKWACCNVDATRPEHHGGYYAWGETTTKSYYSWEDYKHCAGIPESCRNIGKSICGTQYDVAHVKWGGAWQMPSLDQITELLDKCTIEWTTFKGVNGRRFTGPNGGSIFLPASGEGYRDHSEATRGKDFLYWSGTQYTAEGLFSVRLEALIASALQDGVLTEQEQAIIIRRAEKEGEDIEEMGMIINARLVETQQGKNINVVSQTHNDHCAYFYNGEVNYVYRCYGLSVRPVAK